MPKHEPSAPCVDKKCSWYCNPIKVHRFFPDEMIPVDSKGKRIWQERDEMLIPERHVDTIKLRSFDCTNLDKKTGLCKDYENRPEICKNTSCVNSESEESVDVQHAKRTSEKFIQLRMPKR